MSSKTGNLYRQTNLRNGGRKAGFGTLYDDYSEDSMSHSNEHSVRVKLPHDNIEPEELNGPIRTYKEEVT